MNTSNESAPEALDEEIELLDEDPIGDDDEEFLDLGDEDLAGDTEILIRRIGDLVSAARPMPLSASAMVNRDELLQLVEEAQNRLPDELRSARWLLKEREDYLAKSTRDGEDLIDAARARAEQMVQRTEVVKAADLRARQIVERAEADARRMRNEAEDFCDQKLGSFEIVLEKTLRMVGSGREKLQGSVRTGAEADAANGSPVDVPANGVETQSNGHSPESDAPPPPVSDPAANGGPEQDADSEFFDQDVAG